MQSRKPSTEKSPPATDERRRKFLKTALAGAFAAPVVTSLAVDHLVNQARAQQAYVPPTVTSFTREVSQTTGAQISCNYEATFSQPIDTLSVHCWSLQVFSGPECNPGNLLGTYFGDSTPSVATKFTGDHLCLILYFIDETCGLSIPPGSPGSVKFEINPASPGSGKMLGVNNLAVVNSSHCLSYEPIG